MSVPYECCVLSGTGLCDGPISRPQESYQLGVSECDREVSIIQKLWPTRGCRARSLVWRDGKQHIRCFIQQAVF
jgi:hypothetical protein